jgi:hypothetical protein
MPLDKQTLRNNIKSLLDQEIAQYQQSAASDPNNVTETTTAPIADAVVEHVHEQIEQKLETIISLQMEMANAVQASLPLIAPPGSGGPAAANFASTNARLQTELAKILADLKRSTT